MIHEAIYNIYDLVKSIKSDDDGNYKAFDKDDKEVTLDKNKVEAEVARLQANWDSQDYARKRKTEYPSIPEQLDYIYHNGVEKWKTDMVLPVKEKYPKGDS
jgi:hypothetical protein